MDKIEVKLLLGKILGEVYRMQKKSGVKTPLGDAHTFALLNGFESEINAAIDDIGFVSAKAFDSVAEILDEIFSDIDKMKNFKGFYDIEHKLKEAEIDRATAIKILKYMKANGQFEGLISKMNSEHSPIECRTFELDEWDN